MLDKRSLGFELGKALSGALQPNKLNRSLYVTLADGQPIWLGSSPESYVRDAYSYNPDVYSIVKMIARAASAVPWVLHEVTNQKSYQKYRRMPSEMKRHNLAGVITQKEMAMEEVEDGHPLYELLQRPNPYMGMAEFFESVVGFKLITGNSYVHGVRIESGADKGKFGELWVMPAQLVEIIASNDPEHVVRGYKLNWYKGVEAFEIPADEVMHMKYFNPNYQSAGEHLYGMSPLQAARRVVTRSNEAYTANAKMLKNMSPPGILMLDDDNVDFTPEQASQLERQWSQRIGSEKAGKVMVSGAKLKWQALGLSPVDLNIIESQKMDLRDICNVYGISSELLNDPDNKTNANKRESRMALYYETVIPELDLIRDELNRWLVPAFETDGKKYHLDYDIASIPALQGDIEKQTAHLDKAWWITGNEKRMLQGYDTREELDAIFIPSNLVPWTGDVDLAEAMKGLPADYAK